MSWPSESQWQVLPRWARERRHVIRQRLERYVEPDGSVVEDSADWLALATVVVTLYHMDSEAGRTGKAGRFWSEVRGRVARKLHGVLEGLSELEAEKLAERLLPLGTHNGARILRDAVEAYREPEPC